MKEKKLVRDVPTLTAHLRLFEQRALQQRDKLV